MKVNGGDKKRFGLLLAARDSEYVKKVHGGYFNVFVGAFGEEGDKWDLFRVVEGEFPHMKELHNYDGFVVSGSPHDAYANDHWIIELCFLVQVLDAWRRKSSGYASVTRCCAEHWGGRVGKSWTGWDIGVRKVKIVNDTTAFRLFGEEENRGCLGIIECHQDEVWEIPSGAEVMGFSEKTGVEIFRIGDHILGVQGHPEYTKDILHNLINRLPANNSIEIDFAENARLMLEIAEPDRKSWENICRSFLKGNIK